MKVTTTELDGVLVIEPKVWEDHRGFFFESYNLKSFAEAGIAPAFVQDNHSKSCRHALRGLHFQVPPHAQAKLLRVVAGEVFDVAVDLRRGSPTFGRWTGVTVSAANRRLVFVPVGFAHGFCVLSETAEVLYKCSDFYAPACERTVLWNDPQIGVEWPVTEPVLSSRDSQASRLADLLPGIPF
jgi:dTDP-4-dehydrorhamnose 3,5-epimerase